MTGEDDFDVSFESDGETLEDYAQREGFELPRRPGTYEDLSVRTLYFAGRLNLKMADAAAFFGIGRRALQQRFQKDDHLRAAYAAGLAYRSAQLRHYADKFAMSGAQGSGAVLTYLLRQLDGSGATVKIPKGTGDEDGPASADVPKGLTRQSMENAAQMLGIRIEIEREDGTLIFDGTGEEE